MAFFEDLYMLLYVTHPNPFFKPGTFLENDEHGMVQEAKFEFTKSGMEFRGFTGIVVPLSSVRKYTITLLRKGFDDQGSFKAQGF